MQREHSDVRERLHGVEASCVDCATRQGKVNITEIRASAVDREDQVCVLLVLEVSCFACLDKVD